MCFFFFSFWKYPGLYSFLCRFILGCIKRERNPFLFNTLTLALLPSPFCLFIISTSQLVDLPFCMFFFFPFFHPFTHEFSLFLLFSARASLKGIRIQFVVHLSKEGSPKKGLRTKHTHVCTRVTFSIPNTWTQCITLLGLESQFLFLFSLNSFLFLPSYVTS